MDCQKRYLVGLSIESYWMFQDLPQIQAAYGKLWESFVAQAGVLNALAPRDVSTAEYLSKRGGRSVEDTSNSLDGRPILGPQELWRMGSGFGVLFSNSLKGVALTFVPNPSEIQALLDENG